MLVTSSQTLSKVRHNCRVAFLNHTFNSVHELRTCYAIIFNFLGTTNGPGENSHGSSKLREHAVDNVGVCNWLSSNDDDEVFGENVEEGMEVAQSMVELRLEGTPIFGNVKKPLVKCWADSDEDPKI